MNPIEQETPAVDAKRMETLLLARIAVFLLGLSLVISAIAPMVIDRVVTGKSPKTETILFSMLVLLVGWLFIALNPLMRREVRWAIWVAFLGAAALAGGGISMSTASGMRATDAFLIGLCGMVCLSSWRALLPVAPRRQEDPAEEDGEPASPQPARLPPVRNSKMFLVR